MTDAGETPDTDDLQLVEVEVEGVDDQGNLVSDDLVAAVGTDGTVVATDETLTVVTAEGEVVIDETLSVTGGDGALHPIEEDVLVVETDDE